MLQRGEVIAETAASVRHDLEIQVVQFAQSLLGHDLVDRAAETQHAMLERHDVIGIIGREIDIVDHQDHGAPMLVAQAAQRAHDLHRVLHVQVVQRLVQQQHVGLLRDGHGQEGHLALAAAQFVQVGLALRRQVQEGDGPVDGMAVLGGQRAATVWEAAEGDQFVHRQAQVEAWRLAQRGHAPGVVGDADGAGVAAVQQDLALGGRVQPRHQHQEGGLAGAVGADQRGDAAGGEFAADVGQHRLGAIGFVEVADGDHEVPRARTVSARKYAPHTRFTRMLTVVL